jgi:hypothetical protein
MTRGGAGLWPAMPRFVGAVFILRSSAFLPIPNDA